MMEHPLPILPQKRAYLTIAYSPLLRIKAETFGSEPLAEA
jgi:hypothetical protein